MWKAGAEAAESLAKSRDYELVFGHGDVKYENHYNARLNKCMYLLTVVFSSRGRIRLKIMTLTDIDENRVIAIFSFGQTGLQSCWLQEKASLPQSNCQTEEEWRQLIKPFMEE